MLVDIHLQRSNAMEMRIKGERRKYRGQFATFGK